MTDTPTLRVNGSLRSPNMGYNTGQPVWLRDRPTWNWNGRPVVFGIDRAAAEGVAEHALAEDGAQVERLEISLSPGVEVGGRITYTLTNGDIVEGVVTDIDGARGTMNVLNRSALSGRVSQPVHDAVSIRAIAVMLDNVVYAMRFVRTSDGTLCHDYENTPRVSAPILTEGRWTFHIGSYRVTGVMGVVSLDNGTERSSLLGSDYAVEVDGENGYIVVRDLDLRRWGGRVPEIYVHLVSDPHVPVRVPISEATPLTTRVYGPTTRLLEMEDET